MVDAHIREEPMGQAPTPQERPHDDPPSADGPDVEQDGPLPPDAPDVDQDEPEEPLVD
jgi:hypothetical protein